MATMAAKKRSYQVMAYALSEERRVRQGGGDDEMTDEEFRRRHREIIETCFGKDAVETGK